MSPFDAGKKRAPVTRVKLPAVGSACIGNYASGCGIGLVGEVACIGKPGKTAINLSPDLEADYAISWRCEAIGMIDQRR